MYKNKEGYPDPTAGRAVRKADKPPEEVRGFRRLLNIIFRMSGIRILGKVTVIDERGGRW